MKTTTSMFSLLLFAGFLAGQSFGQTQTDCLNWFLDETASAGGSTVKICTGMERYFICVLRALKTDITPEIEQGMKKSYEEQVSKQKIQCDIDMNRLVQSVRDGTAPPSGPPANSGGQSQLKDIMACVKDSVNKMTNMSAPSKDEMCPVLKDMIMCMIRAMGSHADLDSLSPAQLQQVQAQMDNSYQQAGFSCEFTIKDIIQELKNSGSAVKPGNVLLLLLAPVFLLFGRQLF